MSAVSTEPFARGPHRFLRASRLRARFGGAFYTAVVAAAVFVSLVALLPVGFILVVTVQTGWDTVGHLLFRQRILDLTVNTVLLEAITIPLTVGLALWLAWLTERSDLPGRRIWAMLVVAPISIPAFVHSYAWISAFPRFNGLPAAVLISILAYMPFIYLPIVAQLRRLDPALEDVAASLGDSGWKIFRRVILPQLRFAICGGSLLVGLHLLAEFGLYALIRYETFTTAILDQFQTAYSGPAAYVLAGVLIVFCLGLMALEALIRGNERYARLGPGAARRPMTRRLGAATLPSLLGLCVLVLLALGVPAATLGRWLVFGGARIWDMPALTAAFMESVGLAVAGGVITTLAAMPMAWLSVRAPSRLQKVLEACHYYVGSLPGVVVALALVTVTVRIVLPLYQTLFTALLGYALLFLPRALVGLRASIAQVPSELENTAMSLGKSPVNAIRLVTMRLAAPGAGAAFALCALGITTELTATLMLAPNGVVTLATQFWSLTSEIDYASATPYALLMVVLSLPMTVLLHRQSLRAEGR
jgi:iron(III) transport system permease protein